MGKGDTTRQRIIEDSAPVFNRLGFGSTSMSELMAATGLEKGGLYRHFKSKEDLAACAFEHAVRLTEEVRIEPHRKIASPLDRIEAFVSTFVNTRSPIPGGCPVFNAAVEHDDGNPKLRAKAKETFQKWVSQLSKWVTEAQDAGEFTKEHRAKDVATYLFCTLEGALIARNLLGSPEPLLSAERVLHDYLLSGRLRKKRKPAGTTGSAQKTKTKKSKTLKESFSV